MMSAKRSPGFTCARFEISAALSGAKAGLTLRGVEAEAVAPTLSLTVIETLKWPDVDGVHPMLALSEEAHPEGRPA
jgi:hypothetical protein